MEDTSTVPVAGEEEKTTVETPETPDATPAA